MPRAYPEDPDHVADRQARYRARRAEREARLRDTQERAREAFSDVLAALVSATSAYKELAEARGIDAYQAHIKEHRNAIYRAQKAYDELFKHSEPIEEF